jgi:hypothetical protein
MRQSREKSGWYFQTVARFFLEQRGSPFFLSSKEVEIVGEWEKAGIPLKTVLQGIKDSFDSLKKRPGRRGRAISLAFCRSFVRRSFEAHRERKVGNDRKPLQKRDKRRELRRSVSTFLESCPDGIPEVKQVFSTVQRLFSGGIDEQKLETFEQEVEALLFQMASKEEKRQVREEVLNEFRGYDRKEVERILDLKLAKYIREKYKIPHLSLFYY